MELCLDGLHHHTRSNAMYVLEVPTPLASTGPGAYTQITTEIAGPVFRLPNCGPSAQYEFIVYTNFSGTSGNKNFRVQFGSAYLDSVNIVNPLYYSGAYKWHGVNRGNTARQVWGVDPGAPWGTSKDETSLLVTDEDTSSGIDVSFLITKSVDTEFIGFGAIMNVRYS